MRFEALKVGELARPTRLTIRTLHHYDAIGLLKPSLHTEAGHRLYTAVDVARLQQVLSLRQLGFSLDEVRDCLNRPDFSPVEVAGCLTSPAEVIKIPADALAAQDVMSENPAPGEEVHTPAKKTKLFPCYPL